MFCYLDPWLDPYPTLGAWPPKTQRTGTPSPNPPPQGTALFVGKNGCLGKNVKKGKGKVRKLDHKQCKPPLNCIFWDVKLLKSMCSLRGKRSSLGPGGGGGGGVIEMHNVYPWTYEEMNKLLLGARGPGREKYRDRRLEPGNIWDPPTKR